MTPLPGDQPARSPGYPDAAALRARLRHVYWIGGGSGAGKSTIARRLAARHGLRLYPSDDVMSDHAGRSTPEDSPFLSERGSTWDIARKTSDPTRAQRNLFERDRMFTERLHEEAKRLELRVIEVDTTMTEDELAERVTAAFGL